MKKFLVSGLVTIDIRTIVLAKNERSAEQAAMFQSVRDHVSQLETTTDAYVTEASFKAVELASLPR